MCGGGGVVHVLCGRGGSWTTPRVFLPPPGQSHYLTQAHTPAIPLFSLKTTTAAAAGAGAERVARLKIEGRESVCVCVCS